MSDFIGIEVLRIEAIKRFCNLHSHVDHSACLSVSDNHIYTPAELPFMDTVAGGKMDWHKLDPWQS